MKPIRFKNRKLNEDALFEDDMEQDNGMTDEELKIESLKIATNIGKLMSNVTPEDIVNIAETVAKFIKNGDTSASLNDETDFDESEDEESEDFATDESDENTEESESEESEDKNEDFEV